MSPLTRWAATWRPARSSPARCRRRARGIAGVTLVGPAGAAFAPRWRQQGGARRPARSRSSTRPTWWRWTSRRSRRSGASRASSVRVAADLVARGEAGGALQRGAHRRDVLCRARGVRHAAGRRSSGAGRDRADARGRRDPARRRRESRVPRRASRASSASWARRTRACRSDVERPKVGLLSIGEEAGKGNDLIREAHALLGRAPIDFIGNLEAREFFTRPRRRHRLRRVHGQHRAEGRRGARRGWRRRCCARNWAPSWSSQIGALLTRRAFARFKQRVDYAESGGAPLLGVNGLALVGHGRSSAQAVENGIAMAARLAEQRMTERLAEALRCRRLAMRVQTHGELLICSKLRARVPCAEVGRLR